MAAASQAINNNFSNFNSLWIIYPILFGFLVSSQRVENDDVTKVACGWEGVPPAELTAPASLSSPLHPNETYMLNEECHWLVTVPKGMVVRLTFSVFDLEPTFECVYAYVEVYDGNVMTEETSINKYCGQTLPDPTHTSTHNLYVVFSSQAQGEGFGFRAEATFIDITSEACGDSRPALLDWPQGGFVSPDWPSGYSSDVTCSWRIDGNQDLRLEFVDWLLRPSEDHECLDYVALYDGPTPSYPRLGLHCGDLAPNPSGKSGNSLLIEFRALDLFQSFHGKFHAKFSTVNLTELAMGGTVNIDWSPGFITSPMTENSNCHWRFYAPEGMVIRFEIEYFDLPSCTNCGCASLTMYNGENFHPDDVIGSYCESGWDGEFVQSGGNRAGAHYENYKLDQHKGFSVKFTFFDFAVQACGDDRPISLDHDYGIIASPNYESGRYPNNAWCDWRVQAGTGQVVEVHFLTLSLEPCPACMCDILYTYNGPDPLSENVVHQSCDYRPTLFLTSLPGLYLRFLTNEDMALSGFKLEYEIKNLSDVACGLSQPAEIFLQPGEIFSPGYEQAMYPLDVTCQWKLSTAYEKNIQLTFESFDIEYDIPNRCLFDRLTVYDGDTTGAETLGVYCGREAPDDVTSSQRHLLVEFYSNQHITGVGFHLSYTHVDAVPSSSLDYMVPTVICSVLVAAIIAIGLFVYCRRSKKYKQCRRKRSEPPRPPLRLDAVVIRPRPPREDSNHSEEPLTNPRPAQYRHNRGRRHDGRQTADRPRPRDLVPSFTDDMVQPPSYHNIDDFPQSPILMNNLPPPTYQEALGHRLVSDGQLRLQETSFSSSQRPASNDNDLNMTRLMEDPTLLLSWSLNESQMNEELDNTVMSTQASQGPRRSHQSQNATLNETTTTEAAPNLNHSVMSSGAVAVGHPRSRTHSRELVDKVESLEVLSGSADDMDTSRSRRKLLRLRQSSVDQLDKIISLAEDYATTSSSVLRQKSRGEPNSSSSPAKRLSRSYDNIAFTKNELWDVYKEETSTEEPKPSTATLQRRRRSKSESDFPTTLSVPRLSGGQDSTLRPAGSRESCV